MPALTKKKVKDFIVDGVFFLVGSFIFAISVNTFTAPNNIAPGGLTGAATMLNYVCGIPIGVVTLLMNIPIFLWGLFEVGYRFIIKTIVATILSSVMIDLTVDILPQYQGDMLLTTVFGGFFSGLGLALIFVRGGTTGGTDLIANLISLRVRHLSLGRLVLIVDMVIVVISAFVYKSFESPLYATIVIFITSKVIDVVLYGSDIGNGKMIFIISQKNEEIAQRIMDRIGRGVTELRSRGAYTKQNGEVLLCAVSRQEVYKVYDIIHSIDPDAFTIVGEAGEISGEGFKQMQKNHAESKRKKQKDKHNS
ncbi:MAG TPA: YitT family protein [Firmicutes bacterium]|nr:YitT family protein [Bacillota bacterium]